MLGSLWNKYVYALTLYLSHTHTLALAPSSSDGKAPQPFPVSLENPLADTFFHSGNDSIVKPGN